LLTETKEVRQIPGEGLRRWFGDDYFDLIVWYAEGKIIGFQLCYDKGQRERALTWHRPRRYLHTRVDDGDRTEGYKMTPILVRDGVFEHEQVAERFRAASASIDPEIARLVHDALLAYPAGMA
jgi:hypothetical protein